MNTHNDIERLCVDVIRAQADLDAISMSYIAADADELPVLDAEMRVAVELEMQADGMLDAALDEVFEQTFSPIPYTRFGDIEIDNSGDSHQEAILHHMGLRLADLMCVRELAYSEIGRRHVVASALKCPVDKLCRTRDGSWTMR